MNAKSDIDKAIEIKRANIQKLLYDSFKVDYEEIIPKGCYAHYYKMKKKEFEESSNYIFSIVFGDSSQQTDRCEAFFYNLLDLLHENRIHIELRICTIPIPISSTRWNYLLLNSDIDLSLYSIYSGILEYPLLRTEVVEIYANLGKQPTICSTFDGCKPFDLKNVIVLYDTDVTSPVLDSRMQKTIEEGRVWMSMNKKDIKDIDSRVDSILERIKNEVSELFDFWNEKMDQELFKSQQKQYIKEMIINGSEDSFIISTVIDAIISSLGLFEDVKHVSQ